MLIVDDDAVLAEFMAGVLRPLGEISVAHDGEAALSAARTLHPELILLDVELPGANGFEVCARLQADPRLADIPVIFVTGHTETEFETRALDSGAVDLIHKPLNAAILLARVRAHLALKHKSDALRRLSVTDPLTGIANRRAFDDTLHREWWRALRTRSELSLLIIDIDHFKNYNDHYGHQAGDACLRRVAQALLSVALRSADLVARWGGEEFVLLLPLTGVNAAATLAARACAQVRALAIPHATSGVARHVTVSVGFSTLSASTQSGERPLQARNDARTALAPTCDASALVGAADEALYEAKACGRDRFNLKVLSRTQDVVPQS